jgi:hypothetical protein
MYPVYRRLGELATAELASVAQTIIPDRTGNPVSVSLHY